MMIGKDPNLLLVSNQLIHPSPSDTSSTAQGGSGSFKNRLPIGEVGCCESRMAERSH